MSRLLLVATMLFGTGATLVLSTQRWFARKALVDRLRPYEPGGLVASGSSPGVLSVESFRAAVTPFVTLVASSLTRALGVHEDIGVRLRRLHSPVDPTAFRMRQAGWSVASLAVVIPVAIIVPLPLLFRGLVVIGGPLLSFLVLEQQLISASDRHQRALVLELPVVAEQIGLLLGSGYSLGGAINRLAERGQGISGPDLRRVVARTRQGLDDVAALHEWAEVAAVEPVNRLVAVLALNREAGDLDRLISDEARAIRRDVQRTLIEGIERRSQQVWIPVTVAALIPGAIFIAIPFIHALRAFGTA